MARRLGPYAPLSAMYADDDAIISAGENAELLFVRGLAFCAGMPEQDGYITERQLERRVGAGMPDVFERAQTLVKEGLWEAVDGGFIVRAWLKWNKSSTDLGRERKRDRDRKAAKAEEVRAALGVDVQPEPDPEGVSDSGEDSQNHSERNPDGIRTESDQSPDGFQPRAPAREAGAPAGASGAALHSTPLQQNPLTPTASGGGDDSVLFDSGRSLNGGEPQPCPKHAEQLGRRHGNCRACGTSARAADRVEDEADFNRFWAVYPLRVAPGAARKAWVGARKKADADTIIAGAEAHRDDPGRDPKFTPHPATWLNQERWADQRTGSAKPPGTPRPFWEN
jgi:hypothetical protein